MLAFGTGGMRGKIGDGLDYMNEQTVSIATQALAEVIKRHDGERRGVVVGYDSRYLSEEFADFVAVILSSNGIKVYQFSDMRPTPMLSFAIREKCAIAGVMITASHNPAEHNGYKVYWEDGGQITKELANMIQEEMGHVALPQEGYNHQLVEFLGDDIDDEYLRKLGTIMADDEELHNNKHTLDILYTSLHGVGSKIIPKALRRFGYISVTRVPNQCNPDPDFPTVIAPNPEEPQSFERAFQYAKDHPDIHHEMILATDADADRVGVAVRDCSGEFVLLNGNQIGALMLDYLLSMQKFPTNSVVLKTIVTSELGRVIAQDHGIETVDTLTGFKYIGEKIREFKLGGEKKFLFGYEESYGYLVGDFVRDKDAVQACLLLAEMGAFYKMQSKSLYEALLSIYARYGFYMEHLRSIEVTDSTVVDRIMYTARRHAFDGYTKEDYRLGVNGLPSENVVKLIGEDGSWIAVRPSGTEPKLKFYMGVVGTSVEDAIKQMEALNDTVENLIGFGA